MPAVKTVKGWPPRWLTTVTPKERKDGDGDECADWMEAFCRITEDSIGGDAEDLIVLRQWQRYLLQNLWARKANGRLKHRTALIGVARKNTKSTMSAGIGLYGLLSGYPGGGKGREVYSCAGDKDQAAIVFKKAKRMIEMEPELAAITTPYRDAIEVPATGSVYRVLSAEAYTKEGLNPTLVIFDEVHVQPNRDLWDVMRNAFGARKEPLMVGITTAGEIFDSSGEHSLCYQLYEHGKRVASGEVVDPSFFFSWWEMGEGADHLDPANWSDANPGLGDLMSIEDMETASKSTPEAEFRTKRCNQWVVSSKTWLPAGAWDGCLDEARIPAGAKVVLSFDGSFDEDSTGLVATEVAEIPRVETVAAWERSENDAPGWRVPIIEVEDVILATCGHLPARTVDDGYMARLVGYKARGFKVVELSADPARWSRSLEICRGHNLPVEEFPQSPERMTPATQGFFQAVVNKQLRHPDDPAMARHLASATLKTDSRGSRLSKGANYKRKIDLAVCAVMGHHRARWHNANQPEEAGFWASAR